LSLRGRCWEERAVGTVLLHVGCDVLRVAAMLGVEL
jgi:hypothetical protein